MITVRISGPATDRPHDLASKLASMQRAGGKVVRQFFDDPGNDIVEARSGHVDVTVISTEEKS